MSASSLAKHADRITYKNCTETELTAALLHSRLLAYHANRHSNIKEWTIWVCDVGMIRAEQKRRAHSVKAASAMAGLELPQVRQLTPEQAAKIAEDWHGLSQSPMPIMATDGDAAYPEVEVAANTGSDVRGWCYVDVGGKSVASFANAVDAYEYARSLEKRIRSKD